MRLVIEQTEENQVQIRILTWKRAATNVTPKGDWPEELFSQIALELNEKSPCD